MEGLVQFYFAKGLALSTQRTYKAGHDQYLKFCHAEGFTPLPLTENGVCAYVSTLADQGLKHSTIKVYLSSIRYLQISSGHSDPFAGVAWSHLDYVMRGIKKSEAEKGIQQKTRLPVTPVILHKLRDVWLSSATCTDAKMMWAACCLCYFGFLRCGEMTVRSNQSYDKAVHLSVADIAVDDATSPSVLQVRIKESKTDPFRKGVCLFLGRTGSALCPVAAVVDYLCQRGMSPGPLFVFEDGRFLTRQRFVDAVIEALERAGVDQTKYCGHSFRIGAATTAAARGVEDAMIKTLGRWESVAYLQYMKIPRQQLAGYSCILSSPK